MSEVKVTLGGGTDPASGPQSVIQAVKTGVAQAIMAQGLPGSFSIAADQDKVSGTLDFKPTISAKDGRVMYNLRGELTVGGITVKVMGNGLLPKKGFMADPNTLKAYQTARAERDAARTTLKKQ